MKLHYPSCGLGAKDDGVCSLRLTTLQTSSVGAFSVPCPAFGFAPWSEMSGSYQCFHKKSKAKNGAGDGIKKRYWQMCLMPTPTSSTSRESGVRVSQGQVSNRQDWVSFPGWESEYNKNKWKADLRSDQDVKMTQVVMRQGKGTRK